jgi:hypothetical protein
VIDIARIRDRHPPESLIGITGMRTKGNVLVAVNPPMFTISVGLYHLFPNDHNPLKNQGESN